MGASRRRASIERWRRATTLVASTADGARPLPLDIVVDRGQVTRIADSVIAYREEDLSRHLANGNAPEEGEQAPVTAPAAVPAPAAAGAAEDVLVEDYQLNEALNLLKGLNVLKAVGVANQGQ